MRRPRTIVGVPRALPRCRSVSALDPRHRAAQNTSAKGFRNNCSAPLAGGRSDRTCVLGCRGRELRQDHHPVPGPLQESAVAVRDHLARFPDRLGGRQDQSAGRSQVARSARAGRSLRPVREGPRHRRHPAVRPAFLPRCCDRSDRGRARVAEGAVGPTGIGTRRHRDRQDAHHPIDRFFPLSAAARGLSARSGGVEHLVRRRSRCGRQSGAAEAPRLARRAVCPDAAAARAFPIAPGRHPQSQFASPIRIDPRARPRAISSRFTPRAGRNRSSANTRTRARRPIASWATPSSAVTCWIWSPARTVPSGCLPT